MAGQRMSRTASTSGCAYCKSEARTSSDPTPILMKELRCQHEGRPYRVLYALPYRVLYAFDPRRIGIMLIGGDKTGNPNWYQEYIPKADAIYEQHLKEITQNRK
jgi:hypothetical protein